MPKVLRIINRFNLGGPTYNVAYLTKYMAPEFETLLIGGMKDDSEDSSEFIVNNLDIKYEFISEMHRSINPLKDIRAYRQIKKKIKAFQPDIVHTHAAKSGTLGRLAAISCGVPVIVHTFHGHVFHSYFNPIKTAVFKRIEKYLAMKSSRIVAISERQRYELSEVHEIADEEKFTVIPLGFDLARFREGMEEKRRKFRKKYLLDDDEIAIGIVGRLVPIKNHGLFLEAINELKKADKKIRAFIIGDGESRTQIEDKAKKLGLDYISFSKDQRKADVTFTSWIKNVDEVYSGIDIVALTSLNEGTPVSLIEAQAAGCPIVSTEVGGVENVVKENFTALLSKSRDTEGLTANLLTLINDKALRQKFSENGWGFVSEKFDYNKLVNRMKDLYKELL